jgi:DNA-binding IclR family transcriptional regulator
VGPPTAVPRPTGIRSATLDHRGAFLLTFIDGATSIEDIIDASGLPKAEVLRILDELAESRVITLGGSTR